ncbi:MAG: hypothetical protein COW01_16125 [Bdellovibrionales bacterium CG12_big_fil_rev_8_21_14_0_65_38_15]|nr:MAG: hypothetical protein COW79_15290 [Bdellovibrionales bacterium CG22_combo_CG10-13_8_21_14_all_38_13]PIQ52493.1 MAG: hypothetical protein COW01_16125 [Bdellovibrionales bacterium CG12_big_fil_rev_8_21_14_0_65_38_15]PIR29531.1 MAG: hypothetical protein COV38_10665 [Bdellovibrionales bacterium CG11_big_fil_rev_8_21_14_0_20_38_13]
MRVLLLALLLPLNVYASFFEYYGSGAFSAAQGNQATLNNNDPSNHYYHPASMAWNKTILFSAHAASVSTDFNSINNIVTKNGTNSGSNETGDARTDYGKSYHSIVHASLPLAYPGAGPLSLSFVAPFGGLAETNSGDARLPEYVMYHSRHKRSQIFASYAHPINEDWAIAVGTHLGFQASADASTQASLNGANYGSSASAKSKIDPTLAAVLSTTRKHDDGQVSFTYQQEMKSNLSAVANGEINDPTSVLFSITLDSMIYYDPHIFRLSLNQRLTSTLEMSATAEYQLWSNYKAPTIFIKRNGGVILQSDNYENLKIKDIPVAHIGFVWHAFDSLSFSYGAFWRPTPIEGDFSGAGNSLDSDVVGLTTGFAHSMKLFEKDIEWGVSAQYHMLKELDVVKTSGQENGSAGSKIGAPGYKIGGEVLTGSIGARMMF